MKFSGSPKPISAAYLAPAQQVPVTSGQFVVFPFAHTVASEELTAASSMVLPSGQTAGVNTKSFATRNLVEEQSVRKRYSQTGSFHGVVPTKLASGRLLWPSVIVTVRGAIAANDDRLEHAAADAEPTFGKASKERNHE